MRDKIFSSDEFDIPVIHKEVIIVGNGPGGLAASYVLAGHSPIYNGLGHPDPMLSTRLTSTVNGGESLLSTDRIRFLAQGMEEIGGPSPVGALFDSLLRPGALSSTRRDSQLSWHRRHPPVDHVVLGDGPPGGIWQRLDPHLLTLSLNSWMELPGLRMTHTEQKTGPARRASAKEVADYYLRYVFEYGLSKYQQNCRVTSIKNIAKIPADKWRWEIEAVDKNGNQLVYRSRYCILACGLSVPKRLEVDGEDEENVAHDLAGLDAKLEGFRGENCRVLVVGAGLSAADAVLLTRFKGCTIAHSFRADDVTLGQMLPESLYPEYHKVREMMRSQSGGYPGYRSYPGTTVTSLVGGTATLEDRSSPGKAAVAVDYDLAGVFIGSSPDLSFLKGLDLKDKERTKDITAKPNSVSVDPWTYEVRQATGLGLYAIGALAGDIYVRYIPGGSVAACAHILAQNSSETP